MKNILILFEIIKLAPLILKFQKHKEFRLLIANSEQQKKLSNQSLKFFSIKADINLDIMTDNQQLCDLQANLLTKLNKIFKTQNRCHYSTRQYYECFLWGFGKFL
ncbi:MULTISPECIES: hypothetical protein [unclassified Campylobacter]|uniref:hypothetical protein n=1 Tax=unclassified Campylobacter TaxID=2593542 RepID=UPI0012383CF3|nr:MULTISPECIES: hypothetical protein [unclassified Campylobacter]KAA6226742.1 hypothetical protein FMM55_04110 [Campylobacter sp. LR196d]KAA6228662.1 hypothetical protein FMM54_00385 [Campylobacter sp. LR185c]KAA6229065.1 hypothetical protein FMM57_01565 [Campylobacter sp. LR286c]KAA6230179.1 hypothetical protein FMM58_05740 [Campylobacter sp. LR291e]KAA6233700.1 hypothetical protein FMM56_01955 [Campylobacter sp. LR264d]